MPYLPIYSPQPTRPSGGPQPGTLRLVTWTISSWDEADAHDDVDPVNLGVYNPRDICGNPWPEWKCPGSQHAAGRAGDIGFPVDRPKGHPEGWKYARWLVANHLALGIQEVIWAGQRWTNQTLEWRGYTGRSDHFDHVHLTQTQPAAESLTIEDVEATFAPSPPPPDEESDMPVPPMSHWRDPDSKKVYRVNAAATERLWIQTAELDVDQALLRLGGFKVPDEVPVAVKPKRVGDFDFCTWLRGIPVVGG